LGLSEMAVDGKHQSVVHPPCQGGSGPAPPMQIVVVGNNDQGVAIGTALQRANLRPTILPSAQTNYESFATLPHTVGIFACSRTVCTGNCHLKQLRDQGSRTSFLVLPTTALTSVPTALTSAPRQRVRYQRSREIRSGEVSVTR